MHVTEALNPSRRCITEPHVPKLLQSYAGAHGTGGGPSDVEEAF